MRMHIKEFADFSGVSVRTLHYYDEIGILKPAEVDINTGYRYYDDESALRMQEILFYRELDFPLKSIKDILTSAKYDRIQVLNEQKELLTLKKERLVRLICSIDSAIKGVIDMQVFDSSEFEKYKAEAKEKWGETDAYREYEEVTKNNSKEKWDSLAAGMDTLFAKFSELMKSGADPSSAEARNLVKSLQGYITENCYTCTDGILAGLGQMYIADERFRKNIDQPGEGTAEFVSHAIEAYCRK